MPDKKSPSGGTLQIRRRVASDTIPRRHMNTSTDSNTQQLCAVGGNTMARKERRGVGRSLAAPPWGQQRRRPGEETKGLVRAAYKAKRESSVRSAFLLEPAEARAG